METYLNKLIISSLVAKIVSISLNKKILNDIDTLQKDMGFSGRSEVVRAAVRMLIADSKQKSKLKGLIEAVMITIHEHNDESISQIKHKFTPIIKTQVHSHLEKHKCMEIFVLKGDASLIKEFYSKLESDKKNELTRLFIS